MVLLGLCVEGLSCEYTCVERGGCAEVVSGRHVGLGENCAHTYAAKTKIDRLHDSTSPGAAHLN